MTYWPYISRIAYLNLKLRYYCTHNQIRFSAILTVVQEASVWFDHMTKTRFNWIEWYIARNSGCVQILVPLFGLHMVGIQRTPSELTILSIWPDNLTWQQYCVIWENERTNAGRKWYADVWTIEHLGACMLGLDPTSSRKRVFYLVKEKKKRVLYHS